MSSQSQALDRLLAAASAHLSNKQYEACHKDCMAALRINPSHPEPFFLLSVLTADHDNHAKALDIIDRALAHGADNPRYQAQKAKLLALLNQHDAAAELANSAAAQAPTDAFTVDTLGVVFSRTGHHDRAVPLFEAAAARHPNRADYHYNLGSSLRFSGAFDRAEAAFEAALRLDPSMVSAHYALATLRKQTPDRHRLDTLEDALDTAKSADARLHVGHALAKTYEDLGDYAKAAGYLSIGKELKRAELKHDPRQDKALFDAALETANLPIDNNAPKSADLVFVVGMPRTGTTLTDRILSSHSQITSAGELAHFGLILKQASRTSSPYVLDPETLKRAETVDLQKVGEAYREATQRLRLGSPCMIDKMPLNILYAPLILKALPEARIVCVRRGAMDTCLSNYRQLFRTSYSYYNYSYDLTHTAAYYAGFSQLVDRLSAVLPANRFTTLRYEDVIAEQERETRRLFDFVGLPFEEATLRFHENAAPTATASSVQVRQPLYSTSIGRWRAYGDALTPLYEALKQQGINPETD